MSDPGKHPLDPRIGPGLRFAPRVARPLHTLVPLALLAAGCSDALAPQPAPLDRFLYPAGMAVRRLAPDAQHPFGRTQLLVVSSNFDLRWDEGNLLSVDPDASGDALQGEARLEVLGAMRLPSFGGELAVADATTCPGTTENLAIATSRSDASAFLIGLAPDGSLDCGAGCRQGLSEELASIGRRLADPYGVVVACRDFAGAPRRSAFVTYLRTPLNDGWITEILLEPGRPRLTFQALPGAMRGGAYHAATGRMFLSDFYAAIGGRNVRWLELFDFRPELAVPYGEDGLTLGGSLQGEMARGLALSTDGQRLYAGVQLYDAVQFARSGALLSLGGALAVVDVRVDPGGLSRRTVLRTVPLEGGAAEVRVIPRPAPPTCPPGVAPPCPQRDLVAVTSPESGGLVLYDDESGAVVKEFGLDPATGRPELGRQPFGLALETLEPVRCRSAGACHRLFVGSFEDHWVNVVEIDAANPAGATVVKRIRGTP